ncbi:protein of unknown function [Clostridium beijerinckii]|nr:protein of unknown function [Clostridium beijerinckii]
MIYYVIDTFMCIIHVFLEYTLDNMYYLSIKASASNIHYLYFVIGIIFAIHIIEIK